MNGIGGVTRGEMNSGEACVPAVPGLAPWGLYGSGGGVARVNLAGLASEREAGCRSELAWSERRAGCPERTSGEMTRATPTHPARCVECYRAGLASEREAGCRSELAWSERRAGCPERTSGEIDTGNFDPRKRLHQLGKRSGRLRKPSLTRRVPAPPRSWDRPPRDTQAGRSRAHFPAAGPQALQRTRAAVSPPAPSPAGPPPR